MRVSKALDLRGSIVVVTGATSGVGRATALHLAECGANVVIAARRAEALDEVATLCTQMGVQALAVPTDVTSEEAVNALAAAALERFGRIDAWVNNAGVTLYQLLENGPVDEHLRVIETNLFGAIYGARAALPIFRKQGRGILVNLGSVLSEVGQALVPAYVISKFGVRGLSEALRVEVADEPDIHVCTVLPYAIDTPHFQVGANRMGLQPRALPPVQSPEKVARAIAAVLERPRRQLHVPGIARLGLLFHAIFPVATERLLLATLRRWHLSEDAEVQSAGNLYTPPPPSEPAKLHGDRPPQLSTPRLMGWLALELGKQQLSAVVHHVRSWRQARA